jgi:TolB protein
MKSFIFLITLFLSFSAFSQDAVIAVGQAEQEKDKLVIDDPEFNTLTGDQKRLASEFIEILKNDFAFYKHKFNTVEYTDKGKNSFTSPDLDKWQASGIAYFVTSRISSGSGDKIDAHIKIYSVLGKKEIFNKNFIVAKDNLRGNSHVVSDAVYRGITGKPSVFTSKIVFVSDRLSSKEINKELYMMDFDGRRVDKLTNYNSVVISPSISPDNSKIIFSLIAANKVVKGGKTQMIKNIDLRILDLKTNKVETVSAKPGMNSGAIFGSSPNIIYLTLTFSGNADIYEMNLDSGKMRKVTSHYGDDVDPSVTKDGSLMTFLSNRPGRAHIYTMDPTETEKNVKRISFVGQFNATPRFSPDGREIVFTSWVDNGFDLYRIGADGNNLVRLTKNFGSNEEAAFSPDGEFIIFTSKRIVNRNKAVQNVYIMNREGEILGQLTQDFGRCFSPQWTNL